MMECCRSHKHINTQMNYEYIAEGYFSLKPITIFTGEFRGHKIQNYFIYRALRLKILLLHAIRKKYWW